MRAQRPADPQSWGLINGWCQGRQACGHLSRRGQTKRAGLRRSLEFCLSAALKIELESHRKETET